MRDAGIGGRWVEDCLIRFAGTHRFSHGVIDLQNNTLGAVLTEFLLIFTLHDRKRFYNVVYIIVGDP